MTDNSPQIFTKRRPNLIEQSRENVHRFPSYALSYLVSLFPIAQWIGRYNLTWLYGDAIAGFTVGAVVIPQGMAYAKVVNLPPEYGLYSSFVGVSIYFLFATSKDITIGPTAVMSLVVSQLIADVLNDPNNHYAITQMASSFAFFAGIFSLVLGLLHLGFIVDLIPGPVIAGFTTGSAITIAIGQIAKLMGIPNIKTTEASYLVLGKTLGALPKSKLDAAFGFVCLFYLYTVKYGTRYGARRWPRSERLFFIMGILRNFTAVILATIFAYVVNIGKKTSPISILKKIPSGLHVGVPVISQDMISDLGGRRLFVVTAIIILEHVALTKSFGRINDYKINPSQEFIAIGLTNAIGSLFHAYPSTGSFSRTAINAKSGVRTPLAGIFSGVLVIISLYSTAGFYYIPDAALSAIIIHAVLDLISSPDYVKQLWRISFCDFSVFVVGVVFTFFFSVEIGIYASVGLALVIIILRIMRPRIVSLGQLISKSREKVSFVQIDHPAFESVAVSPPDGIIIFRFVQSIFYPNSNYLDDQMVEYVRNHTKKYYRQALKKGDRPWNETDQDAEEQEKSNKPRLRAIVFDMSAVNTIDSTGVQSLVDAKKAINKYADRQVEYHFANLLNEDVEQSLLIGGFGVLDGNAELVEYGVDDVGDNVKHGGDEETTIGERDVSPVSKRFFHYSVEEAVEVASSAPV